MSGHEAIARALGTAVRAGRGVSGGDINQAEELTLADGRVVFAKTNARADPAMFPAEARGLAWLAEAGALRVPRVLAVSGEERYPDDSPFADAPTLTEEDVDLVFLNWRGVLAPPGISQERTDERPSNVSRFFHARTIVSCTASSASKPDPSIR